MIKTLGVMLDCSRNAVMSVDAVKKYVSIIKKMGYNTLMLYTEDTYEVDNNPFFGHQRGKYSKSELKEIDNYCISLGIELIPCIQTLAHLNCMFKWVDEYDDIRDCDDILLVGDDRVYALIESMISSLSSCFKSRKIHIGMDEAYNVGLGKYRKKHGIRERFDIINEHLHKVCEICEKYGFKPMIWSDMFCKLAAGTDDYYKEVDTEDIRAKANLPENISLVYWDYYSKDYNHYVNMININKAFGREVYFAGGAWTWRGFAPYNKFSIETTAPAVKACIDCGIENIFFTVWGDDGSECSYFSVLPSLMFAAEATRGNTDVEDIKIKFKSITGCDFDSFMMLDLMDMPGGKHNGNPSKYIFYNDLFSGILDYCCSQTDNSYYQNLSQKLKFAEGTGEFAYIFEAMSALADVLAIKSDLGLRIRREYKNNNKDGLKAAVIDCDKICKKIRRFYSCFKILWFKENKPYGFDIQDIRIGGLIFRIESCKERLDEYLSGNIKSIPELEEPMLECNTYKTWGGIVSPNVISHIV